jgi:hypothetical protein
LIDEDDVLRRMLPRRRERLHGRHRGNLS